MKKMEEPEKDNSERWMLTYLDLITLLMVFFVLMYSMSNVDSKKYASLTKSLNMAMGGGTGYFFGSGGNSVIDLGGSGSSSSGTSTNTGSDKQLPADASSMTYVKNELEKYLNDEKLNSDVVVETNERGLDVRLKDSILFDSGDADIKDSSKSTMIKIGNILSKIDGYIRVEGYTDNVPIANSKFKSNWELSAIRATNVVELLIGYTGIQPDKISAVGYGSYRPIANNSTPQGRAKNRRVEIVIMNSKFDGMEEGN